MYMIHTTMDMNSQRKRNNTTKKRIMSTTMKIIVMDGMSKWDGMSMGMRYHKS